MALPLRLSILPLLCLAACSSPSEDSGPLKIGELYRCFENTHEDSTPADNYYMRFTDNDTVLNTVSAQSPAEVRAWFRKGQENVNSEKYDLDGNEVTINYDLGATYDGAIEGDRIFFNVTLIGGAPYKRNYQVVK